MLNAGVRSTGRPLAAGDSTSPSELFGVYSRPVIRLVDGFSSSMNAVSSTIMPQRGQEHENNPGSSNSVSWPVTHISRPASHEANRSPRPVASNRGHAVTNRRSRRCGAPQSAAASTRHAAS